MSPYVKLVSCHYDIWYSWQWDGVESPFYLCVPMQPPALRGAQWSEGSCVLWSAEMRLEWVASAQCWGVGGILLRLPWYCMWIEAFLFTPWADSYRLLPEQWHETFSYLREAVWNGKNSVVRTSIPRFG